MKEFEKIKERIVDLDRTLKDGEKEEVGVLMADIVVCLKKIAHKKEWNLYYVLGEAMESYRRSW